MIIGDIIAHLFDLFVHLLREIGTLAIEIMRHPESWLLLAIFSFAIVGVAAQFAPDLSFLGIPGLVTISDLANPDVFGWLLLAGTYYGFLGFLLYMFPSWAPGILFLMFPKLWWLWLFLFLFPTFRELFIHLQQERFKASIKWVTLELKMPRLVPQTPQAMEQVFNAMHALRNSPGNVKEVYLEGEVTRWFALEMISIGGDIHFYIRCRDKQKNVVEAALFAYYPDVEVVEVEDYMDKLPKLVGEVYQDGKDLFGTELQLAKEDAYPIKTYPLFETPDPEKRLDPISSFLEVLSKVKPGEFVGIQFLIAPSDKSWVKDWKDLLKKLKNPDEGKKGAEEGPKFVVRTPGETEVLKAVEGNLSKPAFDTIIRLLYLAPKETFNDDFVRRGVLGAFNQYSTLDLNAFKANSGMSTKPNVFDYPHMFFKQRGEYRKQRILHLYRKRDIPPQNAWGRRHLSYLLNHAWHSQRFRLTTEGMATIFHPPTEFVLTAPHLKRVESRKAGPPAGLAIFGEEESIERFYPKKEQ